MRLSYVFREIAYVVKNVITGRIISVNSNGAAGQCRPGTLPATRRLPVRDNLCVDDI